MEKVRFKIVINWKGEVHEFYRHATSASQALHHAVRELARKVGYSTKFVRDYVMDTNYRRWEVIKMRVLPKCKVCGKDTYEKYRTPKERAGIQWDLCCTSCGWVEENYRK